MEHYQDGSGLGYFLARPRFFEFSSFNCIPCKILIVIIVYLKENKTYFCRTTHMSSFSSFQQVSIWTRTSRNVNSTGLFISILWSDWFQDSKTSFFLECKTVFTMKKCLFMFLTSKRCKYWTLEHQKLVKREHWRNTMQHVRNIRSRTKT